MLVNMKARLCLHQKIVIAHNALIEMKIWQTPRPVPPSVHHYKYRLAYIVDGVRVVGFDNERGKGDHIHLGNEECAYRFAGPEALVNDFLSEVEKWRAP